MPLSPPALIILAAALIGVVYGLVQHRLSEGHFRAVFKTLCVALLAVAAWVAGGPVWLVVGLALCALGDFLLAYEGEAPFLAGLVAFLTGHLAYVALFWQMGAGEPAFTQLAWAVIGLVILLSALMTARLWPHTGPMRLPVLAYTAVIAAMVISAELFVGSWMVRAGVLAFMLSDMVLARGRFLPATSSWLDRHSSWLVWFLYAGGQVLITVGALKVVGEMA